MAIKDHNIFMLDHYASRNRLGRAALRDVVMGWGGHVDMFMAGLLDDDMFLPLFRKTLSD